MRASENIYSKKTSNTNALPKNHIQNNDLSMSYISSGMRPQSAQHSIMNKSESNGNLDKSNAKSIMQYASKATSEQILSQCHAKMQDLTRSLEKAKCKLALAVDFNLGDLFRFFTISENPDTLAKGYIDSLDVARVCRYLKIMPSANYEEAIS